MFNTFFRTGLRTVGKYGLPFSAGFALGAATQSDYTRSRARTLFGGSHETAKNGKKVVLIGAGKVGLETLKNILADYDSFSSMSELVVLNTNPNKVKGFLMDWRATHHDSICVKPTNQVADMKDASLVVMTAGLWPTDETKAEFHKIDSSGRLVQSFVNKPLVENLCVSIQQHAPNATVFVVTNQLDMMTEVARQALPNQTVIGVGNMLDTLRFKRVLADILFQNGRLSDNNPSHIEAFIGGYHNNRMILLRETLQIDGKRVDQHDKELKPLIKQAMEKTIAYGKEVSDLQKQYPGIDSGSSILPGFVTAQSMKAFLSSTERLIASFNIRLPADVARHVGLPVGASFGVPVVISDGKIVPLPSSAYIVTDEERQVARIAHAGFQQDMAMLNQSDAKSKPSSQPS